MRAMWEPQMAGGGPVFVSPLDEQLPVHLRALDELQIVRGPAERVLHPADHVVPAKQPGGSARIYWHSYGGRRATRSTEHHQSL